MIFDTPHWTRVIQRVTYLLLSMLGIYLAFKLSIFYMPFLIAFIISLIMEPAIKFMMSKADLTRRASAIIIFIIVFGIIAGGLVWGIVTLISEATRIIASIK